jgi:hypothetical protein
MDLIPKIPILRLKETAALLNIYFLTIEARRPPE